MYTTSLVEGGVIPPQVSVGGRLAGILYFGDAPGYPGYFQSQFPGSRRRDARLVRAGRADVPRPIEQHGDHRRSVTRNRRKDENQHYSSSSAFRRRVPPALGAIAGNIYRDRQHGAGQSYSTRRPC